MKKNLATVGLILLVSCSKEVASDVPVEGGTSETWKCVVGNERPIYNKVEYTRDGEIFRLKVNGVSDGTDKIIEENEREIILYTNIGEESFITILEKKSKTMTTYGSNGTDPNDFVQEPGFGSCEILE